MLTLINITRNGNVIEADYIPENSSESAHVSLDFLTCEHKVDIIEKYGSMYSRMAVNGLKRIMHDIQDGEIKEAPDKRIVYWY